MWSSSLGDTGLFNNIQPIETPAAVSRPKPKQWERPRRSILTLGSPLKDSNDDGSDIDESFGVFLQSCFYCRRKISPKDDVFMSGCVYMRYAYFIDFLFFLFQGLSRTTLFFMIIICFIIVCNKLHDHAINISI